jgi:hypothetical protein
VRLQSRHLTASIRAWKHQARHRARRWDGKTYQQRAKHLKRCAECRIWQQDVADRAQRDEAEWLDWEVFGQG